ncbi:hypothetical protein [Streptomyces sp. NPDC014734]
MQIRSTVTAETRNQTQQVALFGANRTEAVLVPGACCCTAAIARR